MAHLNPWLLATQFPPIPQAGQWARAYGGGCGPIINLSQAIAKIPPPEALLARLSAAAADPEVSRYGEIEGDPALRAAYAEHLSAIYQIPISPRAVAITSGCNQAFCVALMALCQPGEAVLLPAPWYFNHQMTADFLGIGIVPLPCLASRAFVPDPTEAERLMLQHPQIRALVLVSPNNPTGATYPSFVLERFAELAHRLDRWLILDETYRDFRKDMGPPHALFADPQVKSRLISLYSFSKAYSLPGYRLGAMTADPAVPAEVAKILDCLQICPSRVAQGPLAWAISALASWRGDLAQAIASQAQLFMEQLDRVPGWSVDAIGAYFAYVRHPWPDRSAAAVAQWLAQERGGVTLPGPWCGDPQQTHLRMAFANADPGALGDLPARLAP